MRNGIWVLVVTATLPLLPAHAQADANAVKHAGDAFGYRRGDESVGIYDERSVRGFSLEAAGNYRLNGTYFVKNSGTSSVFIESSTVRIGYNTLTAVLPGPSGVVDYRLRDPAPGVKSVGTLALDAYGQPRIDLSLRHGSKEGDHSYSLGLSRNFNVRNFQGGRGGEDLLLAGIGRVSQGAVTGQLFAGEYQYRRRGEYRVMPGSSRLPPKIERGRYLGQDWAFNEGQSRIAGLLLDAGLGRGMGIGTTLAFGQEDPTRAYLQFFGDVDAAGTAQARLVAVPQQRSTALSAQARAHVERPWGAWENRLDLAVRLRRSKARFGGARTLNVSRVEFGEAPGAIEAPDMEGWSADHRTHVDQWGVGLAYRGELPGRARVNLGLLKTHYVKTLGLPKGEALRNENTPWLYNAGLAITVADGLELYSTYARGLEEAGVAPGTASNRNEILDAILVTQRELGLRWTPNGGPAVILAAFDTRKPYAGIEPGTNSYQFLGNVKHRGVEASVSGKVVPGVRIVLGGVWLDPKLRIEGSGADGPALRPVAVPRLRAIAGVDVEVPWLDGVNLDAALTHVGSRAARSSRGPDGSQLEVEALTTLDLGARYAFTLGGQELVLRAQILNVTNSYAWDVNSSETLAYNEPRRARLLVTTRF